jgi:hypothetical protein
MNIYCSIDQEQQIRQIRLCDCVMHKHILPGLLQHRILNGRILNRRILNRRILNHRILNHRILNRRILNRRIRNRRILNRRILNPRILHRAGISGEKNKDKSNAMTIHFNHELAAK